MDEEQQRQLETFKAGLKAAGVYDKIDFIWVGGPELPERANLKAVMDDLPPSPSDAAQETEKGK